MTKMSVSSMVVRIVSVIPLGCYRLLVRPLLSGGCRMHPTCSMYAQQALMTHKPHKALLLIIQRLLRCHPKGKVLIDPVPPYQERNHRG